MTSLLINWLSVGYTRLFGRKKMSWMRPVFQLIIFFGVCLKSFSQDINFSQFYEMPLLRNPALAGIYKGDIRFSSAFRNQWQAVPARFQTSAAGVETKFSVTNRSDDYISVGLQFTNDVAGDGNLGRTQFLPVFAYHKSISSYSNTYLTAAFIGGGVSQRFDPTKLRFDDQFVNGSYSALNPTSNSITNTSHFYWDASLGLSLSGEFGDNKYYIGAAYFHFNEPKVAFSALNDIRLNKKYVLNGAMAIATSEYGDQVTLFGDYFLQGGSGQIQAGAIFKHILVDDQDDMDVALSAGAFYRWDDAIVPVGRIGYYNWTLGMSYDVNTSRLRTASQLRGGVELTLTYSSYLNIRNSTLQKMKCPVPLF
jgi:type IX secretion system PorP/SprF family membrane protein